MKWLIIGLGLIGVGVMIGYLCLPRQRLNPAGMSKNVNQLELEKYDFDSLRKRGGVAGEIIIGGPIKAVEDRRKAAKKVYENNFETREIFFYSDGKKISGMMNHYPEKSSLSKVIIMIRGYAEKAGYYPGSGTWAVADKLADEGYVTVSLDFLGYGDSDLESSDMLEARFHKVVEVLDLIESVKAWPWVDKNNIGIWAHSNGGQIALSVLEITGKRYPTILWAPMTQKFPESVLSTIEEDSPVKAVMAEFEKHYDARRYAFENYYEWINSPVLIQQGTADEWCKVEWQREVVKGINKVEPKSSLVVYEGDDHNLKKNWIGAVEKDIEWFRKEVVNGL